MPVSATRRADRAASAEVRVAIRRARSVAAASVAQSADTGATNLRSVRPRTVLTAFGIACSSKEDMSPPSRTVTVLGSVSSPTSPRRSRSASTARSLGSAARSGDERDKLRVDEPVGASVLPRTCDLTVDQGAGGVVQDLQHANVGRGDNHRRDVRASWRSHRRSRPR